MAAGNSILMEYHYSGISYSEETYFTWMVFILEIHRRLQRAPLLSRLKHTGPNKFMGTRIFLLDQCHQNETTCSPSHFWPWFYGNTELTLAAQVWYAFMTLPFLRNTFDTISLCLPTSRFPQGIFTVFLSSADPATLLFSFLSSLIYSVIVSQACGFWEGWLTGSLRHKHWNVRPRGGSQISSPGPEANSWDSSVARNSKDRNGYCR